MARHLAVVTTRWGDETDEAQFITRSIAGALAVDFDSVEVILLDGGQQTTYIDGGFSVVRLPCDQPRHLRTSLFWDLFRDVSTPNRVIAPHSVQREIQRIAGGDAPSLLNYLAETHADTILVAGLDHTTVARSARELAQRYHLILLPLARPDDPIDLAIYDHVFGSARLILVTSTGEYERVRGRTDSPIPVVNVGMPLDVSLSAKDTPPPRWLDKRSLMVLIDYPGGATSSDWPGLVLFLRSRLPDVRLILLGARSTTSLTGWQSVSLPPVQSRMDVWRLMARMELTVDLRPPPLLAREDLESLALGTPVIARSTGAGREHLERGNCGLWFRDPYELVECVKAGLDENLNEILAQNGRRYYESLYGDSTEFLTRVRNAVLKGPFDAEDVS